jgi:glucosamine kinase
VAYLAASLSKKCLFSSIIDSTDMVHTYSLIADSGSTKTNWVLLSGDQQPVERFSTSGINPFYQNQATIVSVLEGLDLQGKVPREVFFYGAGCVGEAQLKSVEGALIQHFPTARIEVASDLLAAARSLCGHQCGIAAILGTGSNSCYYDGRGVVDHVSPLGFILGDEGSGAVLGRKLVGDVLKKQLPEPVCKAFYEKYRLDALAIIEKVYRQPFPNRFLAQFTLFLLEHIDEPAVNQLVKSSFVDFFERNIRLYTDGLVLPIHFTGSVAWHFRSVLSMAAEEAGFQLGKVVPNPMDGLADYHTNRH